MTSGLYVSRFQVVVLTQERDVYKRRISDMTQKMTNLEKDLGDAKAAASSQCGSDNDAISKVLADIHRSVAAAENVIGTIVTRKNRWCRK